MEIAAPKPAVLPTNSQSSKTTLAGFIKKMAPPSPAAAQLFRNLVRIAVSTTDVTPPSELTLFWKTQSAKSIVGFKEPDGTCITPPKPRKPRAAELRIETLPADRVMAGLTTETGAVPYSSQLSNERLMSGDVPDTWKKVARNTALTNARFVLPTS